MSSQATFLTIPSHILSFRGNGILEIFVVAKVHYQHIASYDVTISDIGVGCSSAFKERHSRKGPNLLAPMEIPDLILKNLGILSRLNTSLPHGQKGLCYMIEIGDQNQLERF